jgi:alcohol dehydrogenase class IV
MKPGDYTYIPQERVVYGRPVAEAVLSEANRLKAPRLFLVSSRSLANDTPVVETLVKALGNRFAGLFDGCREHTPRSTVVAAANAVRAAAPDLIVTLGGGTPVDTVKILQICLAHDVRRELDMDPLHIWIKPDGTPHRPQIRNSPVRQIIVPTTLSGAEFSSLGAAQNELTGIKEPYAGPDICGQAVILDPQITVYTPDWLWFSTGIRAVDHAVEGLCSTNATPYTDGLAIHALRMLAESLPRNREAAGDLDARLRSQQAVWLASASIGRVQYGASHGIGHVLGGLCGVSHGHTSCVLLPAVLRWNESVTGHKQKQIAEALGRPYMPAWKAVADLVSALGLPTRIRDLDVDEAMLPKVAEAALGNIWVRTNPRRIDSPADVAQILDAAW